MKRAFLRVAKGAEGSGKTPLHRGSPRSAEARENIF